MDIEIVCRDFPPTEAIEYHVNYKLARMLTWSARSIDFVRATLGDENGPRGGVDKYCCLTIQLASGPMIRVEHRSLDLYDAISRCAERAERVVREEISKQRRQGRRKSLALMWG